MKKLLTLLTALSMLFACLSVQAEETLSLDGLMEEILSFDENTDFLLPLPLDEDELEKVDATATLDVSALNSLGLTLAELTTQSTYSSAYNYALTDKDERSKLVAAGLTLPFFNHFSSQDSSLRIDGSGAIAIGTPAGTVSQLLDVPQRSIMLIYWNYYYTRSIYAITWVPGQDTAQATALGYTPSEYSSRHGTFWQSSPNHAYGYSYSDLKDAYARFENQQPPVSEPLRVGKVSFEISRDRQSVYLTKPAVTGGSGKVRIAYNIYDNNSNPVNYFYSAEERVAATPGYGGLFNVFVVVTDTVTGESDTQNIGWQTLDWPYADALTVGQAAFEISPDRQSIFLTRPSIACRGGSVTIAYNIYDAQSNPVNYFYSNDTRVAATPGYRGKFNVFIVVTDTVTGETNAQNIGWQQLGSAPSREIPAGQYTIGTDIPAGAYRISIGSASTNLTVWGAAYRDYSTNGGLLLNVTLNGRSNSTSYNPVLGKVILEEGNVIDFSATLKFEEYAGLDFAVGRTNRVPGGRYTVGEDIPAGAYTISMEDGSTNLTVWGAAYEDYRSNGGLLLNVTMNSRSSSSSYNPVMGKVILKEGNVIDFVHELVFDAYAGLNFTVGRTNRVPGGRYTVGEDIPAGAYTISIESGSTNLTLWGAAYEDYRSNGGLLLNEVLNSRSGSTSYNPSIGKVVLAEGNVINFDHELVFAPYTGV